jgi:hypothetical protein
MPNTITPAILARRFAEANGYPTTLRHKVIARLWAETSDGRQRGRNMPMDRLEKRVLLTLPKMLAAEGSIT